MAAGFPASLFEYSGGTLLPGTTCTIVLDVEAELEGRPPLEGGEKDKAQAEMKSATRKLDKAAKDNIIHKNQAANRKSKMARQLASRSAVSCPGSGSAGDRSGFRSLFPRRRSP